MTVNYVKIIQPICALWLIAGTWQAQVVRMFVFSKDSSGFRLCPFAMLKLNPLNKVVKAKPARTR